MNSKEFAYLLGGFSVGVVTGLMLERKEESTKDRLVKELNDDCNFDVEGNYTAPQANPVKQAKWDVYVTNVMNKFSEKQAKIKEPYSKDNPPKPLTAEEMQLYTKLKNKLYESKYQMSHTEGSALAMLAEYMHVVNLYNKE